MESFDQEIIKKLQDAEMTPSSRVWDAIAASQKSNRNRFWIYFIVGALGLATLAYLISLQFSNSTEIEASLPMNDTSDEATVKNLNEELNSSEISFHTPEQEVSRSSMPTENKETAVPLLQEKRTSPKEWTEDSNVSAQNKKGNKRDNIKYDDKNSLSTELIDQKTQTSATYSSLNNAIENSENHSEITKKLNSIPAQKRASKSAQEYAFGKLSLLQDDGLYFLPGLAERNSKQFMDRITENECEFMLTNDCYKFNIPESKFYLDIYYSQNWVGSSFKTSNAGFEGHRLEREASELIENSYSFGMRVTGEITDQLLARTGVEYTRINEKFNHVDLQVVDRTIDKITIDTIINPGDMDTIVVRDTMWIDIVQSNTFIGDNHYEILTIPLEIGFNWNANRLNYGVFVGAHFNVAFDKQGTVLDADGTPIRFNPTDIDNKVIFKDRIGVSLSTSAFASYEIFRGTHFFVEPHFRYVLKPINISSIPVDKSFRWVGANVGLRFQL